MAFLVIKDNVPEAEEFDCDYVYFDEDKPDDFQRILEKYCDRVREIRFDRPVKFEHMQRLSQIFYHYCNKRGHAGENQTV